MNRKELHNYQKFVEAVTSKSSNNHEDFISRVNELENEINVPLLLTGAIGLCDESGEFAGLVKKIIFHGKELTEENKEHLTLELSDILWYWINSCRALDVDPYEVIEKNIEKLQSRYPGGKFSIWHSENRSDKDV